MKNKNFTKKFVLIFIFLFIFLLILLILLLFVLQNNDESGLKNGLLLFSNQNRFQTVQDAIEKSGSTYLKEESNRIYVIFGKDLYDKNGNSNERYFEDLKNDVIPFFKNGT